MSYTQLTLKERYHISACRKLGYKQKEIALELGVSPSIISRELRRNRNAQGHYDPESAQIETKLRHRHKHYEYSQEQESQTDAKNLRLEPLLTP